MKYKNFHRSLFLNILFINLVGTAVFANQSFYESSEFQTLTSQYSLIAEKYFSKKLNFLIVPDVDLFGTYTVIKKKEWRIHLGDLFFDNNDTDSGAKALILCHEIGHVFGGYPFSDDLMAEREFESSSEGQADYYATQTCLKKYYLTLYDWEKSKIIGDPQCLSKFEHKKDQFVCEKVKETIKKGAHLLEKIHQTELSVSTPAEHVTNYVINWTYPSPQCRVDTWMSGLLCNKHQENSIIPGLNHPKGHYSNGARSESFKYSCEKGIGARPRCWFK